MILHLTPNVPSSALQTTSSVQPHILRKLCHADTECIVGFVHDPGGVFIEPVHAGSSIGQRVSVWNIPQERNSTTYSGNKISEKEVRFFSLAISTRQSCLVAIMMSKKLSSASVSSHVKRTLSCFD